VVESPVKQVESTAKVGESGQRNPDCDALDKDVVWRNDRFVFFAMLLFAALSCLFSAVAFIFDDLPAATLLSFVGLLAFVGVIVQMLAGLNLWIRLFYGLCGLGIFIFIVLRGGHDNMALYGCLAMTPGFVAILGWRVATLFLGFLALFIATVFFADLYVVADQAFPLLLEVKFFISFAGLSLFCLGHGYAWESAFEQLLRTNRQINALAYKDPLTVLPNRRLMEDLLVQRWEEYKRSGHIFAVLLCNIDDFKRLNDLYGRDFCDGVLVRIANVLAKSVRSQDVISRWSGDEFLVILPGQTQGTALKVAERLRRRVEEIQLAIFNKPVVVSISIGVTDVEAALSATDIISVADAGLYQAKHRGKNRVMSA